MKDPASTQLNTGLVFLKLGGSLITDKMAPRTAKPDVIDRLIREIKAARENGPGHGVLLGHGSGSFGHTSGKKYRTREGVFSEEDWHGFAEVMFDAASLNSIVMEALVENSLPAAVFPPSGAVVSCDRLITSWDTAPIQSALDQGLIPVIYGDAVFDDKIGGTILSTEDLFFHLVGTLKPARILLAGQDPGVWQDFPACTKLYKEIRPADRSQLKGGVSHSEAPDVTGGMADKVSRMLDLVEAFPGLECSIFSGKEPGAVSGALSGDRLGTLIRG